MSPRDSVMPLSRIAKVTTRAAPATPQIQNSGEGRSPPISAAKMLVASGRMPSTTPPCAAGTVCMAIDDITGKPNTSSRPARNSWRDVGARKRLAQHGQQDRRGRRGQRRAAEGDEPRPEGLERHTRRRQRAAEDDDAEQAERQGRPSRGRCRALRPA